MKRRDFIIGVGAAVSPFTVRAQQSMPVIGYIGLLVRPAPDQSRTVIGIRRGLAEFGYREGHNFLFEYRYAGQQYDRIPALAEELVRRQVDLIITPNTASVMAAKATTQSTPIV